jgi:hypothetical protein
MSHIKPSHCVSGLATVVLAGALGFWSAAGAAEFHFVVQDLGEKRAVWVPQEVLIHRSTEMQDGLVFVLENPTDRTHAFAAYGLFEEVMGAGWGSQHKAVTGQRDIGRQGPGADQHGPI